MAELPTGTVTLLFTDIEGSTRLLQELGRDRYVQALTEHRRLLRDAFTRHGGVEVEMQGDSFHFAFPHAREAALAAAEGQQALAEHAWESEPIRVRIGIHTGDPIVTDSLYAGIDVHRAARVMSAGHGGQVLLSESTRVLVEGELPDGLSIRELGRHRLKDLSEPQLLYQLGSGDFPAPKSLNFTNLPVQPTPLVGRERELGEAAALLNEHRLVTLVGPGGTGKTRLALQLAAESVEAFEHGVFWVPLTSISEPDLVAPTIAQAVGAKDGLAEHLRPQHALLLLDNFEHVAEAAPRVAELMREAPGVTVLVTSRAPLHVSGEQEYPVPPLAAAEAIALFAQHASLIKPTFEADEHVAEICRRLEGLPLAIELAAARVKALSTRAIGERLDHRLPLLTGGARDAPARQQTLRATIEWSYELLTDEERRLFTRLSVFAGGCTLEAAEAICEANFDTLCSLVDKSLLRQEEGPDGEPRFLMLETIREYAQERLEDSDSYLPLREAHAEWYLTLAETLEPDLRGGKECLDSLRLLDEDLGNMRAALDWLAESNAMEPALRLGTALWRFWLARGPFSEGRKAIERGLERVDDPPPSLRARALEGLSVLVAMQGQVRDAQELSEESLDLYHEIGDRRGIAETLNNLGTWAESLGDRVDAKALYAQSEAEARAAGDPLVIALVTANLGNLALGEGDHETAVARSKEAAAIHESLEDEGRVAMTLVTLGSALAEQGLLGRASSVLRRAIASWDAIPQRDFQAIALARLAAVTAAEGDPERGARLLGGADALLESLGGSWTWISEVDRAVRERAHTAARQQLGDDEFARCYAAGRSMSIEESAAYALDVPAQTPVVAP